MTAETVRYRSVDPDALQGEFPILAQRVHGHRLVYLDNANTTQKPQAVIDAESQFYARDNANIHRATHTLSERATQAFDAARAKVAGLIQAPDPRTVIFTRGTTEGINLVAQSWGRTFLGPGDEVLVTWMEHHSNIVPWQLVCQATGATLTVVPFDDSGTLDEAAFDRLLGPKTRFVSLIHVSNALGSINPVKSLTARAHARGVPVLIDGAQAVPHMPVDVQDLDCDFYVFSAHKMYGPTGVGALYGKRALLEAMPPWQGGGDMIASVTFAKTTYNELPYKFEAGTPNIAGVVGFGAAVDFLGQFDLNEVAAHEDDLLRYAVTRLSTVPGLRFIGAPARRAGLVSFVLEGVHPHDIGTILDREGIAVRTGQHCAQPVMDRYGVPATVRASFALYNTRADVDALIDGLTAVREVFG